MFSPVIIVEGHNLKIVIKGKMSDNRERRKLCSSKRVPVFSALFLLVATTALFFIFP